uniref:ATP synthase peripheral stalk subunit F6, mitochondrial n=1 Tax=Oncorhynchus kisutch TaxID=8019 RepID=A0A8C7IGF4_ONCKI
GHLSNQAFHLPTPDIPHIRASGGLVDAGPMYEKALSEEMAKLQRLYGGGDLTDLPDFQDP